MTTPLTLEWLGCATFRIRVRGLTLWFDTYVDRIPGTGDVGLTAAAIDRADCVFLSHAHFDHMLGADTVAANTGAIMVGSYETMRVLRANDVADAQLLPVSGGETIDCAPDVRVRVFPSLHSCLFAAASADSGASCLGDLGVSHQERRQKIAALFELIPSAGPDVAAYFDAADSHCSHDDGGQLIYLLETPDGSVLVSGSAGYWSGIFGGLRPDVAVLALAGRPNVDGEPFQGSSADYLVGQVELLKPSRVVLCHHDALLPAVITALDTGEAVAAVRERASRARLVDLQYADPLPILDRWRSPNLVNDR
jgi:L-ascorbate metabolism protein UlaG (beta-lactamase superfamily)